MPLHRRPNELGVEITCGIVGVLHFLLFDQQVDGTAESFVPTGTVSFAGGTLGADMEIGSRQGGFDAFQGNIDELRIFDTAIYQQASPFTPPTRTSIPEPASVVMLLAGGALMLLRRRGR